MSEIEARIYVAKTKVFYSDLLLYVVMNLFLFFVWLLSDGWYFWPFWIFFGWGLVLLVRALSLGLLPQMGKLDEYIPFLGESWEEEQLKKYTREGIPSPKKKTKKT